MIPNTGRLLAICFFFLSCTSEANFFFYLHTRTQNVSLFLSHHINHVIGGHLIRSLIIGIIYQFIFLIYVIIMENEQTHHSIMEYGEHEQLLEEEQAKRENFLFLGCRLIRDIHYSFLVCQSWEEGGFI